MARHRLLPAGEAGRGMAHVRADRGRRGIARPARSVSAGRMGRPPRSPSEAAQRRRRPGPCARGPEQAPDPRHSSAALAPPLVEEKPDT